MSTFALMHFKTLPIYSKLLEMYAIANGKKSSKEGNNYVVLFFDL
jgi:hypothetical protein